MPVTKRTDNSQAHIELEREIDRLKTMLIFPRNPNGEVKFSSTNLAKIFGKRHSDVIRTIENLKLPKGYSRRRCAFVDSYKDAKGEKRKYYLLTEEGVSLVIMTFSGEKAVMYKLAFIRAFEDLKKHVFEKKLDWIEDMRARQAELRQLCYDNIDREGAHEDESYRLRASVSGLSMRELHKERDRKKEDEALGE